MSLTPAAAFHDPDVPRQRSLKTLSRALLSLAWRESRTARRRLLLYMSSISLGVAALVAIDSFASNVTESVREQSRALLGGDVAFGARQGDFTPKADSLLDSLSKSGIRIARQTTFASMGETAIDSAGSAPRIAIGPRALNVAPPSLECIIPLVR